MVRNPASRRRLSLYSDKTVNVDIGPRESNLDTATVVHTYNTVAMAMATLMMQDWYFIPNDCRPEWLLHC